MTINSIKAFKIIIFLAVTGLLAACENKYETRTDGSYGDNQVCEKIEPTPVAFAAQRATPSEIATCEAAGGSVSPQGLAGFDMCVLPFCDAGEVCSDSSECIGKCFAEDASGGIGSPATGLCQPNSSPFGCRTEVTGGTLGATLCVD